MPKQPVCSRGSVRFLAEANDGAARTQASIDLAQAILTDCGHGAVGEWDDTLRACLLGASADKGDQRGKDYEIVLDEQKAPSIDVVRSIVAEAEAALTPAGSPHPAVIAQDRAALPAVPLPGEAKVIGKEKDAISLDDPAPVQKLIEEWNQNAGNSPYNTATARKLAGEILKAIEPQVTLWSCPSRSTRHPPSFGASDRVVSGDPLLLRKHRYFDFVIPGQEHILMRDSEFISASEGLGSWMEGGFSQFGLASGFAAAAGWKQGGSGGSAVVAEEIAAIRSATWDQLPDADLQLATLRILAAREWIVASAQNSERFTSLSQETSGLLSLLRRADLLNGIEERDWQQVWASITLPDLFRLWWSYLRRYPSEPSPSPVTAQLRVTAAADQGARLDVLGMFLKSCSGLQPHSSRLRRAL